MRFPQHDELTTREARVEAAVELHSALAGCARPVGTAPPAARDASANDPRWRPPTDVDLPVVASPEVSFWQVVRDRRSTYRCADEPPDREQLSVLLQAVDLSPSAGGLRSTEVRLVVPRRCQYDGRAAIEAGVYRYDGQERVLRGHAALDPVALAGSVMQPEFVTVFPMLVVLVADLDPMLEKYSLKNYQMVFADAGVLVQNLHLACGTAGLVGCAIGGIDTTVMHEAVAAGPTQIATMAFAVGRDDRRTSCSGGE
ncbi:hypothetical protein KEM60_02978 [Austwickia sp. TVS 96-490-7B]|uniref:nitroreductase family protein n=1 Tax=Austwickia sp. TVS 96-490-7B TaxID=2830843 RepID=UPI001C569E9F|nr:nitroreductase family protein [Austwickia sp. TVS 96-490-7B]MBW3086749.1 hypothetical protein [Austwickia sp. TVS 96-490-7B]